MLSGRAFRAQLVLKGQRELFDYWLSSAGRRRMPARSDLDPLKIPRLLPDIGLIEIKGAIDDARFRLAGTRLHQVYGQEITGKPARDVFAGEQAGYWHRVHESLVAQTAPLSGAIKGPAKDRDHIVLFWLRLPLSEDGRRVDRILCYDVAGPAASEQAEPQQTLYRYPRIQPTPLARRVRFG
jgi:hypothetical protein